MTTDPSQESFLKFLTEGFWDHFWTCFTFYESVFIISFLTIWKRERRWWHWFLIIPLGILAIVLFLLPLSALVASCFHKFGWKFPEFMNDLKDFLNRDVLLSPKVWHILILVSAPLLFVIWRKFQNPQSKPEKAGFINTPLVAPESILSDTGTVPDENTTIDQKANDNTSAIIPEESSNSPSQSMPPTSPTVRRSYAGAVWEQKEDKSVHPFCPRKNCNQSMKILREDAQRKGMILTLQDRQPRNVYLSCSNPGCQNRIPTNMPKEKLEAAVRKLFAQ